MNSEQRDVITDALIREGLGLLVMAGVLWYLGPGRSWTAGIARRLRAQWQVRRNWIDTEVAQFRGQMSRWEHEQAEAPDRAPGGGPCGCDG